MLKKVLIGAAILGGLFYAMAGTKKSGSSPESPVSDDIFVKYDNYQLQDKDGYWMVIKDGKVFGSASDAAFYAWQTNGGKVYPTQAPESIWLTYANTDKYGGNY